jgi:hypothetical protein
MGSRSGKRRPGLLKRSASSGLGETALPITIHQWPLATVPGVYSGVGETAGVGLGSIALLGVEPG